MFKVMATSPLSQWINDMANNTKEDEFKPIYSQSDKASLGLICIFHGLGGNPKQYEYLIPFFNEKKYSVCLFQLPEHTSKNTDLFNLTEAKIFKFISTVKTLLESESNTLFFVGVSFGASFARQLADYFKSPLEIISPFIEPHGWLNYLLLKTLYVLDHFPYLKLGNKLSHLLPRFPVGSEGNSNVPIRLPAASIYQASRLALTTHWPLIQASKVHVHLCKTDRTISNFYVWLRYGLSAPIIEYTGKHNLLNKSNPPDTIKAIKQNIITFFGEFTPAILKPNEYIKRIFSMLIAYPYKSILRIVNKP